MRTMSRRRVSKVMIAAIAGLASFMLRSPRAEAYSWMIRHGYTSCSTCHADPSGGGLLTPYGRAQGALLMSSRWGSTDDEALARLGEFVFGAVTLPDPIAVGGEARAMEMLTRVQTQGASSVEPKFVLMQADLQAGVDLDRFRAGASVGVATDGAFAAAVVDGEDARLVSRTHWVGLELGDEEQVLVRAGRMNIPFGLRMIEHTAWVRSSTRTDVNASQQHGVAIAYTGGAWRGEAMFVAGNYQVHPDAVRERGYGASVELWPAERFTLGASSLITHSQADAMLRTPLWRHAHGVFARAAPVPWLVLLGETDFLLHSQPGYNAPGLVGWAQADFEPVQGLHLLATAELQSTDLGALGPALGGWASVAWFFAPHADLRLDLVVQNVPIPGGEVRAQALLGQLHFYL